MSMAYGGDAITFSDNSQMGTVPAEMRNLIINGRFQINQRGVSGTVTLAAGQYGHDRFKAGAAGCTYSWTVSGTFFTITISAGSLMQVVENVNVTNSTYTLSWIGTSQCRIVGGAYAASPMTFITTPGYSMTVEIGIGTIKDLQLEAGSVASPFGSRLYGSELILCQRYAQRVVGVFAGYYNTGTNPIWAIQLIASMRTTPTMAYTGALSNISINRAATSGASPTSISFSAQSDTTVTGNAILSAGSTAGFGTLVGIGAGLNLIADAEL